jgi:hypothetical protein
MNSDTLVRYQDPFGIVHVKPLGALLSKIFTQNRLDTTRPVGRLPKGHWARQQRR